MSEARLTRRSGFTAYHHYSRSDWSEVENRRAFGAQVDSHAHDWVVELELVGPIDDGTGFAVDLKVIDDALAALLQGWAGGDLNELIPEVREGSMQPSTESIARWLFLRLVDRVPFPARLVRVGVSESDELGAAFPA